MRKLLTETGTELVDEVFRVGRLREVQIKAGVRGAVKMLVIRLRVTWAS